MWHGIAQRIYFPRRCLSTVPVFCTGENFFTLRKTRKATFFPVVSVSYYGSRIKCPPFFTVLNFFRNLAAPEFCSKPFRNFTQRLFFFSKVFFWPQSGKLRTFYSATVRPFLIVISCLPDPKKKEPLFSDSPTATPY